MESKIIHALQYRYATKKFDPSRKVSREILDTLLETARLTATSYGMQLMKAVLVEDQNLKDQLVDASYGQRQVADAAAVIVLCSVKQVGKKDVEEYLQRIHEVRETPMENLEGFRKSMNSSILSRSEEQNEAWMKNQVYIALGQLLLACGLLEIDSCPMEGFKPAEYDRILELDAEGLTAVLALPVGYRSLEDKNAAAKKVRRSSSNFVIKR